MRNVLVTCLSVGSRMNSLEECISKVKSLEVNNFTFELLILENSITASTKIQNLIGKYRSNDFSINHCLESRLGIPFARNAALKYAVDNNFSFLAFIDDDAYPEKFWLNHLMLTQKSYNANAVTGPQIPIFPQTANNSFKFASIFSERKFTHNTTISWAATNNVLMDVKFFYNNNLFFNEQLTEGGEDKNLFLRATKQGATLYWDAKALVYENVVDSRMTVTWVMDRSFRHGATGYAIESSTKSKIYTFLTCLFKGNAYILKSIIWLPVNIINPKKSFLDSICDFFHGLGFFYGLWSKGRFKKYI